MTLQDISIPTSTTALIGLRGRFDLFTDQDTDESGELIVNLTETPTSVKSILVNCCSVGFIAKVKSITAKALTLTLYKIQYQKTSEVNGALINLPASVTEATTAQSTGGGGSPIETGCSSSGSSTTGASAHTHAFYKAYQHSHNGFTFTGTNLDLATSESGTIQLVIFYQY